MNMHIIFQSDRFTYCIYRVNYEKISLHLVVGKLTNEKNMMNSSSREIAAQMGINRAHSV